MTCGIITSIILETIILLRDMVLKPALAAGMVAAWPYNYWRLKRYGKACHYRGISAGCAFSWRIRLALKLTCLRDTALAVRCVHAEAQ